jgi:hypothetical protein
MAVSKKPKLIEKAATDFIEAGGSVGADQGAQVRKLVQLRVPVDMIAEIDGIIERRPYKQSRHTWLLDAVYEKMERERQSN